MQKKLNADYLLLSNTSFGNDLAPRLAVKLNAGCIVDCVNLICHPVKLLQLDQFMPEKH